jgi:methionyl-tRNA synthetase
MITKHFIGQVRAMVQRIRDLSVSRDRERTPWALPVPSDPRHSIYVWVDALTNYLTTAGGIPDSPSGLATDSQHSTQTDAPVGSGTGAGGLGLPALVHVIGKDIVKFHAVYWPAFLMAAGLPLPKRIISHAHWTVDGRKMAKRCRDTCR